MRLTPVYDSAPVLVIEGDPTAVVAPTIRQRLRFLDELAALDDAAWATPSRCEGWTARDVIVHLDTTNAFWRFSIEAGLSGAPTRFLVDFDPVASPAQMVAGAPDLAPAELLARFDASTRALCDLIGSLDPTGLEATAEAPPGHLAVSAVVHHALWDSLVHEHDVLDPLGVEVPHQDDEVLAALAYAAGLGAGYDLTRGVRRTGRLALVASDPAACLSVQVADQVRVAVVDEAPADADVVLRGSAHALLEQLSVRAPLEHEVADDAAWLVSGLATVFDT